MTKINFNGHQVDDVLEGVYAVINHYVNPVVGMIRLDDEDGRPCNKDRLRKAYMNAAVAILEELGKHVTERLTEERERIAQDIRAENIRHWREHRTTAPVYRNGYDEAMTTAVRIVREGA